MTNTLYTAYAFALERVHQSIYVTTTRNPSGASVIQLTDAHGKALWLMWNTNGPSSASFTHDFGFTPYRVWDVWGGILPPSRYLTMGDPYRVVWVQPYQ